jgi:hypothetical protein
MIDGRRKRGQLAHFMQPFDMASGPARHRRGQAAPCSQLTADGRRRVPISGAGRRPTPATLELVDELLLLSLLHWNSRWLQIIQLPLAGMEMCLCGLDGEARWAAAAAAVGAVGVFQFRQLSCP